jgi:hypothetical protein
MQIENEEELKDNQPHFVNDPDLEQEDDDLDAPGMADTDSLLSETDDDDVEDADYVLDDEDADLDDDLDVEDDELEDEDVN